MRHSLLTLLVLFAAVASAGCTRRPTTGLPPGVSVEDLPDAESWNVRLLASADGQPDTEIVAPYLARYVGDTAYVYLGPPPGDTAAAAVSVRLFDDDGQPRGSVQAREVWLYESPERVVAEGNARVTVSGSDGATVQSDRVAVEGRRVEADGRVRAEVSGASVQAPRLVLSDGGAFAASGGAVVRLTDAGATVRARSVEGSGGRYVAQSGVRVVTSGGRTLESSRVVWDESARQFSAPNAFSFDGPGERVRGVGLRASADLSRYSFRRASGEIEVRE